MKKQRVLRILKMFTLFFSSCIFTVSAEESASVTHYIQLETVTGELARGGNAGLKVNETFAATQQQQRTVTGVVSDNYGDPVIGANVFVKGTTNGIITDIEGRFSLNVESGSVLVVSYIGYQTQEIVIGEKRELSVTLLEDMQMLDDVVVIGFGSQKKVNLTGAVSNVDSKAFEGRATSNAAQALQGVMPGLNIQQSKAYLNESPDINIRGIGTISDGSDANPLVLIDGMEGDINRLNPQDIESVSVLKDAASSSIYGSRAPFGVILITTKKGASGKMTVNYNNSLRWQRSIHMPESVDSYTFATYYNEAANNAGMSGHFSPERMQKIRDLIDGKLTGGIDPNPSNPSQWQDLYDYGYANTDWIDVLFKKQTFAHEHNFSVTGGSEKVQVYASANYLNQGGYAKLNPDSYDRFSTNLKVTSKLNDYIDINYTFRFNQTDYERPNSLVDGLFTNLSRQSWPTLIAYDPNGYLYAYATHGLAMRDGGQYKKKSDEFIQQLNIVIEPIKGWRVIGDINYKKYHERVHSDNQKIYNHDVNGNPVLYTLERGGNTDVYEYYKGTKYLNANAYTEYEKSLNDHNFKVMVGAQIERLWQDDFSAQRLGIIVPGVNTINTTSGNDGSGKAVPPAVSGAYDEWATAGFFGRLNYNYKERYLLEANIRYDGTSRFRSDKRWNWFPSFSLGWNVAREDFFEPMTDIISTLKFRASYGELGNQNTKLWYPTYLTMPVGITNGSWLLNGSKTNTSSAPGLISQTMGWETVRTLDIGLDLAMLNNRFSLSADWFKRNTDDMIGPAPEMPVTLGTAVPKTNNTNLVTKGWEITVSWRDRLSNGLGYNLSFNIADSKTKILDYPNLTGTVTQYYSGKRMGEIWGFETIGIAKTEEEMQAHLASLPNGGQNTMGNNWGAGDIMYKDLNEDGKIDWGNSTYEDLGDMKVIGNSTPRYSFGINLGADYKGFDVSVFFQGIMKRDYFTQKPDFWGASSLWHSSFYKQHMDYFRNDPDHHLGLNTDGYYPRPLFNTNKNKHAQTRYLMDASYIRLKNLSIGYTLPRNLVHKIRLENLRVFVTGENLWTGTKLTSLYDPETLMSDAEGTIKYPLSAVYSFGINISF